VLTDPNFDLATLPGDVLDNYEAMLESHLAKQRNSEFARFLPYRDDPVGFIEQMLLGFLWSKQKEIAISVRDNRRTAVKSCHDVGKSYIASRIVAWWESCHLPGEAFTVSLAPTFHQVKAILWREIAKAHAAGRLPGTLNLTEWKFGNELLAFGRSPADNDPTAIQGIHAPKVLLVGDEACGLSKAILDAADTIIANDDSRVLLIGNPDDPSSEFAEVCKPGSGWNVIQIDAFKSPNFTGEYVPDNIRKLLISQTWVREKKKKWGKTSPLWISKVRGDFPDQANDALVPISDINRAVGRFMDGKLDEAGPDDLGVDVARMGDDSTVGYRRKGLTARVAFRLHKRDTMEVVGAIIRECRKDKPKRIKIDDIGLGGGVTDRLRQIQASQDPRDNEARVALDGVQICPINVGLPPSNNVAEERFVNLRAELNWQMRILFTERPIALEPNDDLLSQAVHIKYKTPNGEIQIEKKEDMKKRTKGVSPDDWDALVLAFAEPQMAGAGLMDWYRQQAEKAGASPPSAAVPFMGGAAVIAPKAVPDKVTLYVATNPLTGSSPSSIYGMTGALYPVVDGQVVVTPDDAQVFIGNGTCLRP
jgi:hypothetical protein